MGIGHQPPVQRMAARCSRPATGHRDRRPGHLNAHVLETGTESYRLRTGQTSAGASAGAEARRSRGHRTSLHSLTGLVEIGRTAHTSATLLLDQVALLSSEHGQQLVWASAILGDGNSAVDSDEVAHEPSTGRSCRQLQRTNMLLRLCEQRRPAPLVLARAITTDTHANESALGPTSETTTGGQIP